MAFDAYMLIGTGAKPDPEGEATADFSGDTGLPATTGWFEIYSFSWGASNPTTVGTTGTGLSAGKVSISSFNVMKKTEKSSAMLLNACCTGQHYAKATVILRKATGTSGVQQVFLQYDFVDVMVESIQWSGSSGGDDTPSESVSFAFAQVHVTYKKQNLEAGTMETGSEAGWNVTTAKPA